MISYGGARLFGDIIIILIVAALSVPLFLVMTSLISMGVNERWATGGFVTVVVSIFIAFEVAIRRHARYVNVTSEAGTEN